MSTKTFGSSFSSWLIAEILSAAHLNVSPHTFHLLDHAVRKLAHLTEYAIFALFLYHAVGGDHQPRWRMKRAMMCVLLAGLYSLTDEFHQIFVPGRGPSLIDCGVDVIGATLGMVVLYLAVHGSPARSEATASAPPMGTAPH